MALFTPSIVAISEATKDALVKYEFIPRHKIQVIYNGIAPLSRDETEVLRVREELGIPPEAFVVGTVSRLDPVKNQQMMLKAFKEFLDKCPDSYLLMVGDGPDKSELVELAERLHIANRTLFTGFIKAPVHHLAAMDVFLLSSHTEGTSMTLLEAMSLGVPAVATRVGGNPEIIEDSVTGILTEPNEVASFSGAMARMSQNRIDREKLAEAGMLRFREKFSGPVMVKKYSSSYGLNEYS